MLKFLRKYQLILLAVGGSLLMVVFLLQPVLGQLQPDPRKELVGRIGDQKVLMGEQMRASIELDILDRFVPEIGSIVGLDRGDDRVTHWMLLKHEAERLGVMGVQRDGADWMQEIAFGLAQRDLNQMRQMGQQVTEEQAAEYIEQAYQVLQIRKKSLMQSNQGLDEAAFNRVLSTARGVVRLQRLYDGAPELSKPRAVSSFAESGTRILTDQLVLGSALVASEVPEPTDDEIRAHFAAYRDTVPGNTDLENGGNEFGFGYLLPARIKMEWLALDRARIAESVVADPVAVRRRWQRENPDGGDFAADRGAIESVVREELVQKIMTDADEVIRGEILSQTRGLEKSGIYRTLPEDWTAPDLARIAQKVVDTIAEREGVRIPLPAVTRRTDAWLTPRDIQMIPGVGRAAFRVGNQFAGVVELPGMVRGVGEDTRVAVQVGMPVIDPPALSPDGSRYYITVLGARGESAPDSVDEIRELVVSDIKSLRGFRLLESQVDAYREAAATSGLGTVANLFGSSAGVTAPQVRENIFVAKGGLVQAMRTSRPDMRADQPAFRDAVLSRAADLNPLADADSMVGAQSIVVTPLPASRSIAMASIRAKRPALLDDFRLYQGAVVANEVRRMIIEAEDGAGPLTYDALKSRLNYVPVGRKADDAEGDEG